MTSKMVWAAAAVAIVVLIIAAFTYYYSNYASPSPSSSQSPSPSPSASPFSSPSPSPSPSQLPSPSPTSPFPSLSPSSSLGQLLPPTDQTYVNWAGYAVAHDFNDPQPLVTGVSGSWVVPQVEISQDDTFSAVWVGVGGIFDDTLIQTGTEQDCINGTVSYFAWYALLPSNSILITTIEVSPGDMITASVNLVDSAENVWSIYMNDRTTGQVFYQNFTYNSNGLSGEWVVERPYVNDVLTKIANFGSVTLSNCTVIMNNIVGAFGYFPSARILMYNTEGTRLVNTSHFNDGSRFTMHYLTSG